ncbi:MAG: hypothetical protein IPJ74_25905 [Saprospiraceae bacterium]|nr:hypothetical protein [Saprospiraceae bacterium]
MKKDNQYKAILLIFIVITTPFAIWVRLDNAGYIFAGLFPLILFIIIVHHIIIIKAAVELNMILLILITQVLFVLSLLLSVDVNDSGRGRNIYL